MSTDKAPLRTAAELRAELVRIDDEFVRTRQSGLALSATVLALAVALVHWASLKTAPAGGSSTAFLVFQSLTVAAGVAASAVAIAIQLFHYWAASVQASARHSFTRMHHELLHLSLATGKPDVPPSDLLKLILDHNPKFQNADAWFTRSRRAVTIACTFLFVEIVFASILWLFSKG